MLECGALLLRPSQTSERRLILAAETEVVVGFACWRSASGSWWHALFPGVLEVREQEDEPLLFTVRRCWTLLPWFKVCDADGRLVGRFLGPVIQDRNDCRCALRRGAGNGKQTFLNSEEVCLAQLSRAGDDLRLEFGEVIEKEPFVKMLLLASVIRQT